MTYVNVGAYCHGERVATKAALKRALANEPEAVSFDVTAAVGPRAGDIILATPGDIGDNKLSVTGPDPYTARNWYGTVTVGRNSRVTCT